MRIATPRLLQYSGLGIAAIGFVWTLYPSQDADLDFFPRLSSPTFTRRNSPLLLIDEAHSNTHTMTGRFLPLARIAASDGFRVSPNQRKFSPGALEGVNVLIIGNALGFRGVLQQLLTVVGAEGSLHLHPDAFNQAETEAVREWVKQGGGLLLSADHAPCGEAAQSLAMQFGVRMTNGYVEDPDPNNHDAQTKRDSFLLFTRSNGLLESHPVTEGPDPTQTVEQVLSFTGQALQAPEGSTSFLRLSPTAVSYPRRVSAPREASSAANLAQGIALNFGKGRVVILGETAMLTAQRVKTNGRDLLFGLNRGGTDNIRLLLNMLHWLSKVY